MEREPQYPPEFDIEEPCLICGRPCEDCPCPDCSECGQKGEPVCMGEHAEKHGMTWPLQICPNCLGDKVVMPDPEFGGAPSVCQVCDGHGEVMHAYPPALSLQATKRQLTAEESKYEFVMEEAERLYEVLARNYCVTCKGHGHIASDCTRRETE